MLAVLRCLVAFTWAHVAHAAPCEPSKEDGERLQRVLGQADLRITEQKAQGIYTQLDPVARNCFGLGLCVGMWEVVKAPISDMTGFLKGIYHSNR